MAAPRSLNALALQACQGSAKQSSEARQINPFGKAAQMLAFASQAGLQRVQVMSC